MSLNRSEQMLNDYVEAHPEEKRYWVEKVQAAAAGADDADAAAALAHDLWAYFEERSGVASPFREVAQREGLRRTSMRNLAEYWLRLWVAPKPASGRRTADLGG
jgi:hypothetical protein